MKTKCFICHNVGHLAAKCPQKLNFRFFCLSITKAKKRLCFIKKAFYKLKSKIQISQVYLVKPRFHTSPVTSVIINSRVTNHCFNNQDLFSIYTKYKHKFEIRLGQKIVAHGYGNVDLKISDL